MAQPTIPSLLQFFLQHQTMGQVLMPLQAGQHRDLYRNTHQWLQQRGMLSHDWEQGQILPFLPEFQSMLLDRARGLRPGWLITDYILKTNNIR